MRKRQLPYLILGFSILLAVAVAMLALGTRRDSGGIVLPETLGDTSGMGGGGAGIVHVVEITPETVRPAVATLLRPTTYSRVQTVETFWSGGSGQSVTQVYVSGGRTRLDTQLVDGSVRHMLFAGEMAAVWYDDETVWTTLDASRLSPDLAERMPTYETVLDLPASAIAEADYRELDGQRYIYVETKADSGGYTDRYWVGVDTGLLHAAERLEDGTLVYRFTATAPESAAIAEELFLLPDGSQLGAAGGEEAPAEENG